jgi:hypothetical protein
VLEVLTAAPAAGAKRSLFEVLIPSEAMRSSMGMDSVLDGDTQTARSKEYELLFTTSDSAE